MNKTYEHKYKLGERVWIKSPDGIEIEVRIISVSLFLGGRIAYEYSAGELFYEKDVIDKSSTDKDVTEMCEKEIKSCKDYWHKLWGGQ